MPEIVCCDAQFVDLYLPPKRTSTNLGEPQTRRRQERKTPRDAQPNPDAPNPLLKNVRATKESPAADADERVPKTRPTTRTTQLAQTTQTAQTTRIERTNPTAQPARTIKPMRTTRTVQDAQVEQPARTIHFIADVMRKQGLSVSYCAQKLGISPEEARRQANPQYNLTLSQLFAWSEALDAPLSELIPFDGIVPDPIRNRALLLRTMKSARLLLELSAGGNLEFAARTIVDQLIELMPELKDVAPWPSVGQSHAARETGSSSRLVVGRLARILEESR